MVILIFFTQFVQPDREDSRHIRNVDHALLGSTMMVL